MPSQDKEYEVKLKGREIDFLIEVLKGSYPIKSNLDEVSTVNLKLKLDIIEKLQNI